MDNKHLKNEKLTQLYAPYKKCIACPLGKLGRKNVVFGEGNADARLMFIGEAPGEKEDQLGRPFVGRSGILLNKVLDAIGIARQSVYITNIVKCRPPHNRKPSIIESSICKNLLLFRQIEIIEPKIICTLGASALEGLLNTSVKISQLRGKAVSYKGITIIPTYHPAYILRNQKALTLFSMDLEKAATLANGEKDQLNSPSIK